MEARRVELTYNRKIRVAKLKIAFGVILFVLLISVSLFSNQLRAVVYANDQDVTQKMTYRSIYIKPGDTLWSIARDNVSDGDGSILNYVNEIYVLNNLKSDSIQSGGYLMIPCQ